VGCAWEWAQGECEEADLAALKAMSVQTWGELSDGILPTKLHTHRDSCDADNSMQLAALPGEAVRFDAKVDAGTKTSALRQLEASCPAKASLQLKEGAQVMLVKTIDLGRGLANGARGVVVRCVSGACFCAANMDTPTRNLRFRLATERNGQSGFVSLDRGFRNPPIACS